MREKGIIIFGASGLMGGSLYNLAKIENKKVIGTYYKNKKPGMIFFDITQSLIDCLPLTNVKQAVVCSAITKLDECENNPEYSYEINVRGTERLIIELSNRNILPIFISSGAVFDGEKGGYTEDSKKNPISLYGEYKAEVEDFITKEIPEYLIIRPGKVCNFKEMFDGWIQQYKKGEVIYCADDEKIAFTTSEDVAKAINLLLDCNARGIYNINAPGYNSRLDLLQKLFYELGIQDARIKRCSIDDFGPNRAKNSYMDVSKLINLTGFKFQTLDEIIRNYMRIINFKKK